MSEITPIIAVNGVLNATLSPLDRGLAYGDGLFETCRVYAGRLPLWQWHRERLLQGCRRLGLPVDETGLLAQRDLMLRAAKDEGPGDGILKLIVTRGQGGHGLRPPDQPEPTLCWLYYPGEKVQWRERARDGIAVRLCEHRLSSNPRLAGLKHLNRLDYILARSEWADEYPEGLLLDTEERVIEGTISNLFAVLDGRLCTPSLARNGVAGVMRRVILEQLAPRLSIDVAETTLSVRELERADEVFVCNSVFGFWPVTQLAPGEVVFKPGELTRRLQRTWNQWLNTRLEREEVE